MNNASTGMTEQYQSTVLNCSNAFFASNGTCIPRCDSWKQYSDAARIALDAVIIVATIARVVFGVIALVASCINWRTMCAT